MNKLKEFFKDKAVGFYIALAAAAIAFIADIVFIAVNLNDITFSIITFIFILLAVAFQAAACFKEYRFLPVLSALCYGVALGRHWQLGLETLSDVWNDVTYIGGNPTAALIFGIIFFVCTAATVTSCFLTQRKTETNC